jgi:hypothetical protein
MVDYLAAWAAGTAFAVGLFWAAAEVYGRALEYARRTWRG